MRPRRTLRTLLAIGAVAALTSCVQVPDGGPVVEAKPRGQGQQGQQPFNNPPPPAPGASPDAIVAGFLEAMEATPLRLPPARSYLTRQAQDEWQPSQVLVYGSHSLPETVGEVQDQVEVRLREADRIGVSGSWQGRVTTDAARLSFPMTREDGEWRIADAPDALILQRSFYEQNYTSQDTSQSTSLYFYDPSGRILVPEPVHVQQGSQLATALVTALLRGPRESLGDVERTFLPPGFALGLPVAVNRNLAAVSLDGPDAGPLSPQTTQRILAQLAWTLRQDPSITMFQLTVADRVVTDTAGRSRFPVLAPEFDAFNPAGSKATPLTYAVRRGRLVSGAVTDLTQKSGVFGSQRLGIGRFAVSLDDGRVAAVVPSGLQVAVGLAAPVTVLSGGGLLRPAWDNAKRLWEIQNEPGSGATVVCVAAGRTDPLRVPGISGEDVRRFLVSRDGSRLIAIVRGPVNDRILLSRLRYDADGGVTGASRPEQIPWSARGTNRIRDIGWTSPTTIAVLDRLSHAHAEVRILNVDGSTRPGQVSPILVNGDIRYLATSPDQQTPYAVQQASTLFNFSPAEPGRPLSIDGLQHVTYAG
jgi:Lipoprotein LpqB beta-propeller domain/Sporulation and spore germination